MVENALDALAAFDKHSNHDDTQALTASAPHSNGADTAEAEEDWGDFAAPPTAQLIHTTAPTPASPTPAPPASSTDAPLLTTAPAVTATTDDDFAGFDDFASAAPNPPASSSSTLAVVGSADEPVTVPVLSATSSLPPAVPSDALHSTANDDLLARIAALQGAIDSDGAEEDEQDDFASFASSSNSTSTVQQSNNTEKASIETPYIDPDADTDTAGPEAAAAVADEPDFDDLDAAAPTVAPAATVISPAEDIDVNHAESTDITEDVVSVAPSGAAPAAPVEIPPPTDDSAPLLVNEATHPVPADSAEGEDDFGDFGAVSTSTASDVLLAPSSALAAAPTISDGSDTATLPPLTSPTATATSSTLDEDGFADFTSTSPLSDAAAVTATAPAAATVAQSAITSAEPTATAAEDDFGEFEPAPLSTTTSPRTATSSSDSSSLDLASLLTATPSTSSSSTNSLDTFFSVTSSAAASPAAGDAQPALSYSADDFGGFDGESVAFTASVSPGATVHTFIEFASSSVAPAEPIASIVAPALTVSSSPIPAVPEETEEDWGDFDAAPAVPVVSSFPVSTTTSAGTSASVTPDVVVEKEDWSGFDDSDNVGAQQMSFTPSPIPQPSSTSNSPLPSFPDASSANLPQSIPTDFLSLQGAAFSAAIKQKITSIFADILSVPAAAQLPPSLPTAFTGTACASCGAATPAASAVALRMVPRFCLWCGRPVSVVVAATLGSAGVVLPKWKTTVAYASLFVSLGLPMPAPATPRLTQDKKETTAGADDEDGLKVQAGDEGQEEKEEETQDSSDNEKEKEKPSRREAPAEPEREKRAARSSPTSAIVPPATAPAAASPSQRQPSPSPLAVPAVAVDKPKAIPALAPPATKLPDKTSSAEKSGDGRRTPNQLPTASRAEKAREEERERERERKVKTEQASREKEKEKKGGMLGGISGKLKLSSAAMASSITQSISSGLASISPQHAQQKQKQQQQQAMEKMHSSASTSPASSTIPSPRLAPPAVVSGGSAGSGVQNDVDIVAVVKKIEQLVAALPNLEYVREGMEE